MPIKKKIEQFKIIKSNRDNYGRKSVEILRVVQQVLKPKIESITMAPEGAMMRRIPKNLKIKLNQKQSNGATSEKVVLKKKSEKAINQRH